jgi:glycosyltransferase involved in cell wall biosynthesis
VIGPGFTVLEVGGESSYAEFKSGHGEESGFEIRTLFQGERYIDVVSGRGVPPADLRYELREQLQESRPDVVILKGYSFLDSLFALEWARERRVPIVVMSESHAGDFARVAWKEWLKRQLLQDVSAALVGGKPHARYMRSLGVPADRIFMGYDVVDNDHFRQGAERARAHETAERARLSLPARFLLASGRFIPKKDFSALVLAFALYREQAMRDSHSAWDLVILGDGEERESLEKMRAELDLGNHLHLPGFRGYEDLPSYYGLADVFIHPSEREQWGLVVNEAMAAGLPVLVSNKCGCCEDLVLEGKTGYSFSPGDANLIAEKLKELWKDDTLRARMGRNAARRIEAFSPDAFAHGLEKACRRALESPRWGWRAWQSVVGYAITQRTIRFPVDENLS